MSKSNVLNYRYAWMLFLLLAMGLLMPHARAEDEDWKYTSTLKLHVEYTVNQDGSFKREVDTTTLLETQSAVDSAGQTTIGYMPMYEKVRILEAYTILPDGTHVQVPMGSIRTVNDSVSRGSSIYTDSKHKVIIYPKLAPGHQIHYKYVVTRHTPLMPGYFSVRHIASPHFKVSDYQIIINADKSMNLRVGSTGFEGGKVADGGTRVRYEFARHQNTTSAIEPSEISSGDFSPYVEASNFASYEEVGRAYQNGAKGKVRVTPAISKLAEELTKGVTDEAQQVRLLYNWVSKNIRYVALYIGKGGYVPHDSQTILDNRWGDCKDHAVILEALLAAKGIASSPALISADDSYSLPKIPVLSAFNHVINYVPSLDMYLDSTAQFAPFGKLPMGDMNKEVVLTALKKMGKTPTLSYLDNISSSTVTLKILPDGRVEGASHNQGTGVAEMAARAENFGNEILTQKEQVKQYLGGTGQSGTGEIKYGDPSDLDKTFTVDASFKLDQAINIPGPGVIPLPLGIMTSALSVKALNKPLDQLKYPAKCESRAYLNHYRIELPDNIHISSLPTDVNYENRVSRYIATYRLNGNMLEVKRELRVEYPGMVCGNAENELRKELYQIVRQDWRAQVIYE